MPKSYHQHIVIEMLIHIITLLTISIVAHGGNSTDLYHDLFDNYTPIRPAPTWSDAVLVSLDFALYQLKSLDGKTQTLETTGQIKMAWKDDSLSWNPDYYNGQVVTEVDAGKIWTPIVGLSNSAGHVINRDWKAFPCMVVATGLVIWAPSGDFQSSCDLDMHSFPFDSQQCSLDFANLVHVQSSVRLYPNMDAINMGYFVQNKEFKVTNTRAENATKNYGTKFDQIPVDGIPLDLTKSEVKYYIYMERLPAYYLLNIIIPSVVLAFLSAFAFYVPVDSGEKLSLSITILLSFSVFLLILSDNTPNISQGLPYLAVYLTSDICVSALSMVIQMAVLNVYHKVPLTPVPEWLKALIRRLSYISGSGRAEEAPVNEDQKEKDGKEVNKTTEATNRKQLVDEGSGILNKVSKITEKMESHFAGEELREEWKIVGRVFDRVCFFIFITVHLIIFVIGIARV